MSKPSARIEKLSIGLKSFEKACNPQIARYLKHTGMPAAPPSRAGVKMRVVCYEWC